MVSCPIRKDAHNSQTDTGISFKGELLNFAIFLKKAKWCEKIDGNIIYLFFGILMDSTERSQFTEEKIKVLFQFVES